MHINRTRPRLFIRMCARMGHGMGDVRALAPSPHAPPHGGGGWTRKRRLATPLPFSPFKSSRSLASAPLEEVLAPLPFPAGRPGFDREGALTTRSKKPHAKWAGDASTWALPLQLAGGAGSPARR